MRIYPAYKLEDVLSMYASAFFLLLEEGYRAVANDLASQATIALLPNAENEQVERFFRNLEHTSQDPRDIINTDDDDDYTGIEQLKGML